MLNQRIFEEPPMAIGEKKQVVVIKLDCSGSMSYKNKIAMLNNAVNRMLEKCRADELVSKNVEFIIIIYNTCALLSLMNIIIITTTTSDLRIWIRLYK